MKFSTLLSLAAAVVALPAQSSPKVLSLDVLFDVPAQITPFLATAGDDIDLMPIGTYQVDLRFGSQQDVVRTSLDTGSGDLWIDQHLHNVTASKDGKYLGGDLTVNYDMGGGVHGPWAQDTVYLGDTKVSNVRFGLVDSGTFATEKALLGIGRSGLTRDKYDNFPIVLKKQGIINRVAYSLYLNKRQSETGNILFGGIDHAKIDGELVKFPSTQEPSAHPFVPVKGLKINGGKEITANTIFSLDSGYTLTVLPLNVVDEIAKLYSGAKAASNIYFVDCEQDESKFVEFLFDGLTIKIPITQFIWKQGDVCKLGALKKSDKNPYYILGATFLQNVYAVYDWEENTISIAKAKYTDETDIKEIPALA